MFLVPLRFLRFAKDFFVSLRLGFLSLWVKTFIVWDGGWFNGEGVNRCKDHI